MDSIQHKVLFVADVFVSVLGALMITFLVAIHLSNSSAHHQFAPTHIFVCNIFMLLLQQWDIWLRLFIGDYISVATGLIAEWSLAQITIISWVAVAASLYAAFNQAQERIALMERGLSDSKRVQIIRRLKIYRSLLIPRNWFFLTSGLILFLQIPGQMTIAFIYPELRSTLFSQFYILKGFQFVFLDLVGVLLISPAASAMLYFALQCRMVVDSLGIKSMLVAVSKCCVYGNITFIVLQALQIIFMPDSEILYARIVIVYSVPPMIFFVSEIIPFNRSRKHGSSVGGLSSEGGQRKLQSFLRIPKYADAFKKHLQSEYSVENLQFWLAVDDFEECFIGTSPESGNVRGRNEVALELYRSFLCKGALHEVNLPSKLLKSFRDDIFASFGGIGDEAAVVIPDDAEKFSYHMFADAKECIFDLLQKDSFPRFLKKPENADLWNEFEQREMESNVMKSLHPNKTRLGKAGGKSGINSSLGRSTTDRSMHRSRV